MKNLFLIGLILFATPALADDDQATTLAKMQAQLNGLAEQNRTLNGRVEDLQHQLGQTQPAPPMPYGVPVPVPQQQPISQMPPAMPNLIQSTVPVQTAPQTYVQQPAMNLPNGYNNQQELAPSAPQQPVNAFPRADSLPQPVPYTPQLQGESVISPKLEQPGTVIGADGSAITKPNPYQTKVTPPLAPLPTATVDDDNPLEDEFDQIFQSVSNEDYVTAKPQLKAFIVKHPGTDLAGEAYFWLGEIAWSEKNYNEAAINYLKGYKEAPKGSKAPENILKMSLVLKQLGKNAESCKYIARFNNEFPDAHPDLKARAASAKAEIGCK